VIPERSSFAQTRILHLEDSVLDGELVRETLLGDGLLGMVDRVWTEDAFFEAVRSGHYDLILADHQLPNFDGERALEIAASLAPETPFIFVSGTLGEEVAVEALKRGATDYVVKQRLHRLPDVVRRALAEASERRELRRAERALQESEQNFATVVNAIPQLCWMTDSGGRPIWFNQRWYDYTGLGPDAMDRESLESVHEPRLLPEVRQRWGDAVSNGAQFEMIFPLKGADGGFRTFLTRALPVRNESGEVVRWFGTSTDVSAQHDAEEALRRLNETLEQRVVDAIAEREQILGKLHEAQRLETIGQLTGGFAHDFNNLLTPIVGSLDLLNRRYGSDPSAQRLIHAALQGAERARTLVLRLLAFARRQVLEPRAVDAPALVHGMRDLILQSLGPRITLDIQQDGEIPPARVDPNQFEHAVLNLVVNARDAMPEGGTLTIRFDQQQVGPGRETQLRHGDYVRVMVCDTGVGMDSETLAHAVEPFYTLKGIGKGTGLGLSMVHGFAAQSGGGLVLSSEPGQGTCAEIWLPVAGEQAGARPIGHGSAKALSRPVTILVVDDDPIVRFATSDMLSDMGHDVIEAGSGQHALELLGGGIRPDLLISDYLMPVMDGVELAHRVRQGWPDVRIMLATGYAGLAGNKMADLPLLPKPFLQSELAAMIERILSESSGSQAAH
jgi:PAS domain S-box-containing protein